MSEFSKRRLLASVNKVKERIGLLEAVDRTPLVEGPFPLLHLLCFITILNMMCIYLFIIEDFSLCLREEEPIGDRDPFCNFPVRFSPSFFPPSTFSFPCLLRSIF